MRKYFLTLVLLCTILLTGCDPSNDLVAPATPTWASVSSSTPIVEPISTQTDSECLPALENFAYPAGEVYPNVPYQERVLPGGNWRMMSTVEYEPPDILSLEIIQPHEGYDEIWVMVPNGHRVLRYQTDTLDKGIISATVLNTPTVSSVILFLDNNDSVWAARSLPKTLGLTDDFPLLAHYDEINNQFTPVSDSNDFFESSDSLAIEALKVDRNGIFWLIVSKRDNINFEENSSLYSYNPSTQIAQGHISNHEFASSVEIAPDGSIFLLDLESEKLINYFPTSGEVNEYEIPVPESKDLNWAVLYLDNSSHLWVNDLGWFDFSSPNNSPQWFTVIRSPVFLDVGSGSGAWARGVPAFTHESPNGLLWFSSTRGTGWLDTNLGKWCVFTTYRSNVRQDSKGNLWMLAGDTLYMKSP